MKEEVMGQFAKDSVSIVEKVYDGGFADGAAGAEASGITKEQLDAAVTQAYADGVASVHIPETPVGEGQPGYSEEQYQAAIVTAKQAGYDQAVAEDKTPISQETYDAAKGELELAKVEMEKLSSNDQAQEAAIAEGKAKIASAIELLSK